MKSNQTMPARRRWPMLLGLLLVFALVATACGDDDDTEATDTTVSDDNGDGSDEGGGDDDPLAGCGEDAVTDGSPDRDVARCESGYPLPQPLSEEESVTLAVNAWGFEFAAAPALALHLGEFEKENLDVEIREVSFQDALPALEECSIDASIGGVEAAQFNAQSGRLTVKQFQGNSFPPFAGDRSVEQTGLWARAEVFSDPEDPDFSELAGTTLASSVGLGSAITYPIGEALNEFGLNLGEDVEVEQIPSADQPIALENGAVQAAWLLDPIWREVAGDPDYVLVATQPPKESLGGLYAAECFREERREVAVAFNRAIIRTVNTYLQEGYKEENPEALEPLAEITGLPLENFTETEELVFDWEIADGTAERAQEIFQQVGVLEYDEIIPDDEAVDRSLYLEAVRGPDA